MPQNYIAIMLQSLKKKEVILDKILLLSKEQEELLSNPNLEADDFETNMREKARLIEELESLDGGFESLYQNVSEELKAEKEKYAAEIARMQQCIKNITEKSVDIQVKERHNKELVEQKFASVRNQIKQVRSSQKIVNQYYKNMRKLNCVEPQFMDNKK